MSDDKKSYTASELRRKVQSGEDVTKEDEESVSETESEQSVADEEAGQEKQPEVNEEKEPEAGQEKQPEAEQEPAEENDDSPKKPKEKKKKKAEKKDPKDAKIEDLNDKLLRNLAEFENFRNRTEKEKEARFDMGVRSVIEKILPVLDNLERGFDGLSEEELNTPFAKGIEAVHKQLVTAFEEMGVTPIEAIDQPFDPNIHNAVMHDEDDSGRENIITEEFQKGYMYKDAVVRHSMVKVLN